MTTTAADLATATSEELDKLLQEKYEALTEAYQALREKCYKAAQANDGVLMGNDAWLRHAMSENDMELYPGGNGINCTGSTYTMQTMDNEWFDFFIPFSALQ